MLSTKYVGDYILKNGTLFSFQNFHGDGSLKSLKHPLPILMRIDGHIIKSSIVIIDSNHYATDHQPFAFRTSTLSHKWYSTDRYEIIAIIPELLEGLKP